MTKTTRYLLVSTLVVAGWVAAPRTGEAADETTPTGGSHVRSSNLAIRTLIVQATEQSATFRSMVETIDASDSVVYVEEGTCRRGMRACFTNVTGARGQRFLWVKIDVRRADLDVMASIGHELRHTIEVLGARSVTSSAAMFLFYRREGSKQTSGAFETIAAVEAGDAVHAEVQAFRRAQRASGPGASDSRCSNGNPIASSADGVFSPAKAGHYVLSNAL